MPDLGGMRNLCTAILMLACCHAQAQKTMQVPGNIGQTNTVLLPNGWKLSPAGRVLQLGQLSDLPLNLQISKSGRYMAVTNNGQSTQSVQLLNPNTEKVLDEKEVKKSWYGLAFSPDEKDLYV